MAAKDLGTKHTCFKCGTKFYDLKKPAPICPKCGADQRESPALKAPPPPRRAARPAAAVPVPAIDDVDDPKLDEDAEVEADEPDADADVEEPVEEDEP